MIVQRNCLKKERKNQKTQKNKSGQNSYRPP